MTSIGDALLHEALVRQARELAEPYVGLTLTPALKKQYERDVANLSTDTISVRVAWKGDAAFIEFERLCDHPTMGNQGDPT